MGAVFDHKAWRHAGPVYGDLAVGDITQLNVDGVATDFIVVHQGNPDGSLYDESCEGTWLLMKDSYKSRQWHSSNSNDYANSTIHSYLNSTFLALFETAIQNVIKQVKIPYVNGTGGSAVASGSNGLSAKIFLLSGYEVGFTTSVNQYFPFDGAKLDYFVSGNDSSAMAKRIANRNGSAFRWWLRSPPTRYATNAWCVGSDGGCGYYNCSYPYGVRPCMIMPSNQKIIS